jgi:hypothetical protein
MRAFGHIKRKNLGAADQTKPGAESGPRRAKARIYLGANLDEQPLTLR